MIQKIPDDIAEQLIASNGGDNSVEAMCPSMGGYLARRIDELIDEVNALKKFIQTTGTKQ